jgi:vitamin B12 transporter
MKNSLRARAFAPVLSVLSLAVAASLHAQTIELDPVVVSATRIEQKLSDVIPSASVITREEIERSQAATLVDLIQGQPGIEIARNGGPGAVASIFMRGQDSKNVAVFIDGVSVQRDAFGVSKLVDIPPGQIEKVEILRGNMGAIYGESAVGGVINIYTRTGVLLSGPTASITYGSRKTSDAAAGYSMNGADYRFGISLQRFVTDGFSAMNPSQNSTKVNPDKDVLERDSIYINGEKLIGKDVTFGFQANKLESYVEYDSGYDNPSDIHLSKQNSSGVSLYGKFDISKKWSTRLTLNESKFENFDFKNKDPGQSFVGNQIGFAWSNIYRIGVGNVSFGIDLSDAKFKTPAEYDRESNAFYLGFSNFYKKLDYQINIRRDELEGLSDTSSIKNAADTWLLGLGYYLTENFKITGLASTSFRAPNAGELFGTQWTNSNLDLKPEEHLGYEFGLNYSTGFGDLRVVSFQAKTTNAIDYDPDANAYANIGLIENDGFETSFVGQRSGWGYRISAIKQNPKDSQTGARLLKRAKESVSLDVIKSAVGFDWGAKITWSGNRTDYDNKTLQSYTLVNLTASKKLSPVWTSRVKLENAFDEDYQLAYGYNTPPRGVFLTLQYQPK